MTGKAVRSGVGLHTYLLEHDEREKEQVQIVMQEGIIGETAQEIKQEFQLQASSSTSRKKVNHFTYQIVISHDKSDNEYGKQNEEKFLNEYIDRLADKGINLRDTQYYVVRHEDKEHMHYHVVYNKVSNNGKSLNMHNSGRRCKEVAYDISKEYNLKFDNTIMHRLEIERIRREITHDFKTDLLSQDRFKIMSEYIDEGNLNVDTLDRFKEYWQEGKEQHNQFKIEIEETAKELKRAERQKTRDRDNGWEMSR